MCIEVRNLRKSFHIAERRSGLWGAVRGLLSRTWKEIPALQGLGFTIEKGEIVGFLGPNGAGKSTTIKILSGILVPDGGTVEVHGRCPWTDRIAHVAGIGVVFGQRTQLWWDLPVIESFALLKDIYRIPANRYGENLRTLSAMLDLEPIFAVPVRQLSLGQRMRCDLVASLLHDPDVLFLDEPTIGLDAPTKLIVREFILRLNRERKVTVLLTTHDLDDIEHLCRRILVIHQGRLVLDGSLEDIRRTFGRERLLIMDLEVEPGEVDIAGVNRILVEGSRVTIRFDPAVSPVAGLIGRLAQTFPIRDLFVVSPPIDEIIADFYAQVEK